MNIKKALVNLYSGLIWNKEKRRAVRDVLLRNTNPLIQKEELSNEIRQEIEGVKRDVDGARSEVHDIRQISQSDSNEEFCFVGGFLDHGGIDCATYLLTHDMPEKVAALRRGLDEESNKLLDLIFSRMTIFPKGHYLRWQDYKIRESVRQSLMSPKELADVKAYWAEWQTYLVDFPMDNPHHLSKIFRYLPEIFFYHCGLRGKSEKLRKYITGKDFVDGGAYSGDTALFYIKNFAPKCVYSFEISDKNLALYANTMRMNDIHDNKYQICPIGLFDKKGVVKMNDSGNPGTSVLDKGDCLVKLTDLDSFAVENNLNVGFIKTDVEGVGLEALHGMAATIKRDRPVLNLAIYHNPKEFFEIKPALEKITAGLDYKISIESHWPFCDRMYDILIFSYPKELDHE